MGRRLLGVVMAAAMVGCWLLCAAETEAHHEGTDVQPCVTCCANHQVLPPASRLSVALPDSFVAGHLGATSELYDQVVVRLLDPPPKFAP